MGNAIISINIKGDIEYVKIIFNNYDWHRIANNATDLIVEAGVLMQLEGTVYDVANTIHAHPTISEIYMESGFDAFEQPIHK